jgi:hypothetical protein
MQSICLMNVLKFAHPVPKSAKSMENMGWNIVAHVQMLVVDVPMRVRRESLRDDIEHMKLMTIVISCL